MPGSFTELQNLEELRLIGTKIKEIPDLRAVVPKLQYVDFR
jgi:hypothetical protein